MTKFNEALLKSMLALVKERDNEATKVVAYQEVTRSSGYCETCYSEYTEVDIHYLVKGDKTKTPKTYVYSGDFGELIRMLTKE
jgi:hypothetical protein